MSAAKEAVEIIKKFQSESGQVFESLADLLPNLMDNVDKELSIWKTVVKDGLFDKLNQDYDKMHNFMEQVMQEERLLLDRTHENLGLFDYASLDNKIPSRPAELVLNVLLRKAERNLLELVTQSSAMFEKITDSYSASLPSIKDEIYKVYSDFKWLADEAKVLNKPVFIAMETIQKQDIMRQSLDHVIKSLNAVDSEKFDEILEDLTFKVELLEFSVYVIDEVKVALEEVQAIFFNQVEIFESEIKRIIARKLELAQSSKISENQGSLQNSINSVADVFRQGETSYVEYLKLKSDILKIHANVLLKAKLTFKDDISATESEDSEKELVYDTIVNEFGHACEDIDTVLDNISDYTNIEKDFLSDFEQIETVYSTLMGFILSDNFGSEEFENNSNQFVDIVTKTTMLISELSNSSKMVRELADKVSKEKEDELEKSGLSEWKLQTNKIDELAATFTIHSHKKLAGRLAASKGMGFEDLVDDDSLNDDSDNGSGDFVMF